MRSIVWVARKPGDERAYTSPREFSPEFAEVLRNDGYAILAVSYALPPEFDPADFNVVGRVKR